MTTEEKVSQVRRIIENPPDSRTITDPDTVLADTLQAADLEANGIAEDLLDLWQKSRDREGFEALFELLADKSFDGYLDAAIAQSSR